MGSRFRALRNLKPVLVHTALNTLSQLSVIYQIAHRTAVMNIVLPSTPEEHYVPGNY